VRGSTVLEMLLAPGRRGNAERGAVLGHSAPGNVDLQAVLEHFADTLIAQGGFGVLLGDEFFDQSLDAFGAHLAAVRRRVKKAGICTSKQRNES